MSGAASTTPAWRVAAVPTRGDDRGQLSVIEKREVAPFAIARIFYVHGLPTGAERGGHAHKTLEEFIVCTSGRLEVEVTDGRARDRVVLESPREGLYLPPMLWAVQRALEPGTGYFVLASHEYDADDYIRDYDEYRRRAGGGTGGGDE
ncbi:MAG TPA: FdtA/QdtA family cupin domain-containing protein [Gemmatimonadaceae bacterium]